VAHFAPGASGGGLLDGCRTVTLDISTLQTMDIGLSNCCSGLLIRGFGVQVPGGAPVLTWRFYHIFGLVDGSFPAMFAPRLLASPDVVDHDDRTSREPYADGYTQRDIC
jgi:hypothetical protein